MRLRSALFTTLLFLTASTVGGVAQASEVGIHQSQFGIRIRKVFINITGDPKLAHRLLSFFDLEFEDTGIQLTNTEADADAEIDVEVNAEVENANLGIGIMKVTSISNGKADTKSSCQSLGTQEDGEFFDSSSDGAATDLRQKYPDAKTVKLDPASDASASKTFLYRLPGALKASAFALVESGSADVTLRVDLTRQKVPVEEHILKYKMQMTTNDGSRPINSSGTRVISARAITTPDLCPDRVTDLDWLSTTDPLFQMAQNSVKQIRKSNRRFQTIK